MLTWIIGAVVLGILALPFVPSGKRSRSTDADTAAMRQWDEIKSRGFLYYFVVKFGAFMCIFAGAAVAEAHRKTGSYMPGPGAIRLYGSMTIVLSLLSALADWTANKNRAAEAKERLKSTPVTKS